MEQVWIALTLMISATLSLFTLAGRRMYISYVTGLQIIGHLLSAAMFMHGARLFTSYYAISEAGFYVFIFKTLFQFGILIVLIAASHVWLTGVSRFFYSLFDATVPVQDAQ